MPDVDVPFVQEVLDAAQQQQKPNEHHHGQADDRGGARPKLADGAALGHARLYPCPAASLARLTLSGRQHPPRCCAGNGVTRTQGLNLCGFRGTGFRSVDIATTATAVPSGRSTSPMSMRLCLQMQHAGTNFIARQ